MSTKVTTEVVWSRNTYSAQTTKIVQEKMLTEEFNENEFDVPQQRIINEADNQEINIRTWNNRETAEAWVNFILTLNPVSAKVID
jgi:hypothetical protein